MTIMMNGRCRGAGVGAILLLLLVSSSAGFFPRATTTHSRSSSASASANRRFLLGSPLTAPRGGAENDVTSGSSSTGTTTTTTASSSETQLFAAGAAASLISTAAVVPTALDAFWRNFPYVAAACVCGFKACAADLVAQKRDYQKRRKEEDNDASVTVDTTTSKSATTSVELSSSTTTSGSASSATAAAVMPPPQTAAAAMPDVPSSSTEMKKTDWQRNLAFVLYGSLYQGVGQEYIYNHLYPVMFGSGTGLVTVLTKVCFDLLIQTTLFTLPIAYLTKAAIYRYSPGEAIRRYRDDVQNHGLLKKYFYLWGPVQCLTFSVVPEHFRVTFIACVSFFWLIILSSIASKTAAVPVVSKILPIKGGGAGGDDQCSLEDGLTCNIDG